MGGGGGAFCPMNMGKMGQDRQCGAFLHCSCREAVVGQRGPRSPACGFSQQRAECVSSCLTFCPASVCFLQKCPLLPSAPLSCTPNQGVCRHHNALAWKGRFNSSAAIAPVPAGSDGASWQDGHEDKALDVVELVGGEVHVQLHRTRAVWSELKVDLGFFFRCQAGHTARKARGGGSWDTRPSWGAWGEWGTWVLT